MPCWSPRSQEGIEIKGLCEIRAPLPDPFSARVQIWTKWTSQAMLGHFVFMAGARLDPLYDHWRKRAKPTARDKTFQAAYALQKQLAEDIVDGDFSTLKWAKVYIQVKAPAVRVEIDRLEADSKSPCRPGPSRDHPRLGVRY